MGDYVHYKVPTEALRLMCTIPDWEICTASPMISLKHFKWLMISSKYFFMTVPVAGRPLGPQLPVTDHNCPSPCIWTASSRTAVIVATAMMIHRRKLCPILRLVMLHPMAQVRTRESTVVPRNFNFISYDLPFFWFTVRSCILEHLTCCIIV